MYLCKHRSVLYLNCPSVPTPCTCTTEPCNLLYSPLGSLSSHYCKLWPFHSLYCMVTTHNNCMQAEERAWGVVWGRGIWCFFWPCQWGPSWLWYGTLCCGWRWSPTVRSTGGAAWPPRTRQLVRHYPPLIPPMMGVCTTCTPFPAEETEKDHKLVVYPNNLTLSGTCND